MTRPSASSSCRPNRTWPTPEGAGGPPGGGTDVCRRYLDFHGAAMKRRLGRLGGDCRAPTRAVGCVGPRLRGHDDRVMLEDLSQGADHCYGQRLFEKGAALAKTEQLRNRKADLRERAARPDRCCEPGPRVPLLQCQIDSGNTVRERLDRYVLEPRRLAVAHERPNDHILRVPPPMLGRNDPTNVLTKKVRRTMANGGREPGVNAHSRSIHRQAISARSMKTRRTATPSQRTSARAVVARMVRGSALQMMNAVRPTATAMRKMRDGRKSSMPTAGSRPRFLCRVPEPGPRYLVAGSVSTCRSGWCFTWYARLRNFA